MHVRSTSCNGLTLLEESTSEELGRIDGIFIHPDKGGVAGFFVKTGDFLHSERLFLSVHDIVHWGTHVRIRDTDALAPLQDHVRLQAFLEEGRTVLGQQIITEEGAKLGKCVDVLFDTQTFALSWLFPKKGLSWGRSIPASAITEVRKDGIIVRESLITEGAGRPGMLPTLSPE